MAEETGALGKICTLIIVAADCNSHVTHGSVAAQELSWRPGFRPPAEHFQATGCLLLTQAGVPLGSVKGERLWEGRFFVGSTHVGKANPCYNSTGLMPAKMPWPLAPQARSFSKNVLFNFFRCKFAQFPMSCSIIVP